MEIRLNEYVPITDKICSNPVYGDHVQAIKFHGKPVNKCPLKNSKIEKVKEKNKINEIFFFTNGPVIKIAKPKNKDKNNGINIRDKGIKL